MEKIIENYKTGIVVDATLKTAFDSICNPDAWWGNIEGPTNHTGDEFTYRPGDTWVHFKVIEMLPEQKIVWYVTDCHLPFVKDLKEWKDTTLVWNLKTTHAGTEIDFEHIGLAPGIECYDGCVNGWNFYIRESLKALISEGKGMPGNRQKN